MRLIDADEYTKQIYDLIDAYRDCPVLSSVEVNKRIEPLSDALFRLKRTPTINPYEWISVEDDKPKKNGYYLCWRMTSKCGGKEYWQIDKLYWEDNLWLMHHNTFKVADYVTHWMPLPTPPITKEN